jgi:hypothetical protein
MMTKTSQPGAEPANVFEDRQTPGQWRVEWFDVMAVPNWRLCS